MDDNNADVADNLVNYIDDTAGDQPHGNGEKSANYVEELDQAMKRINVLENKIKNIALKNPKKYPDVMFLNYKDRKRIMVSYGNKSC